MYMAAWKLFHNYFFPNSNISKKFLMWTHETYITARYFMKVVLNLGIRYPLGLFAIFLGVAKASDKTNHNLI